MSTSFQPFSIADSDRLLAGVVLLHEASRTRDALADLPKHLAEVLGLSAATLILITLTPKGQEVNRTAWSTLDAPAADAAKETPWLNELLNERSQSTPALSPTGPVARFLPDGQIHVLFNIDADHRLAFDLLPTASPPFLTANNRAWLLSLLTHVARNIGLGSAHVNRRTRLAAPLNQLTRSEWRVLLALDSDSPEKTIAGAISMSVHTIHSHIKNIFRKLRVQSRLSAIFMLRTAERQALFQELQSALDTASTTAPDANAFMRPSDSDTLMEDVEGPDDDQIGDASGPHYRHAPVC